MVKNRKKLKKFIFSLKSNAGRSHGKIVSYHKGRVHKRMYKNIDFNRNLFLNLPALVQKIEYDSNRSSYISLIYYKNGYFSYVLSASNISVGSILLNYFFSYQQFINLNLLLRKKILKEGNSLNLNVVPLGTLIFNIKIKQMDFKCQISRSAGSYSQVIKHLNNKSIIKLKSGYYKKIDNNCQVSIGVVSNLKHKFKNKLKAGRSIWLGKLPVVRGVAMNPIDHPHGGGEGKTSGGRCSVSPWGKLTKNYKTVKNKNNEK